MLKQKPFWTTERSSFFQDKVTSNTLLEIENESLYYRNWKETVFTENAKKYISHVLERL